MQPNVHQSRDESLKKVQQMYNEAREKSLRDTEFYKTQLCGQGQMIIHNKRMVMKLTRRQLRNWEESASLSAQRDASVVGN